jgi:hypothetical protein
VLEGYRGNSFGPYHPSFWGKQLWKVQHWTVPDDVEAGVESADRKAVFYPGGRNSAVQLGSFQEWSFIVKEKKN